MSSTASEPEAPTPPEEALRLCAQELGVTTADVCILPRKSSGEFFKSQIFYGASRGNAEPQLVIKVDPGTYDPEHEQAGLESAARMLESSASAAADRLGVVRPVGWGRDPAFLVTHHQPGELANECIDRYILRAGGPDDAARARDTARQLARWIGTLRAAGSEAVGGLEPEGFLNEARERADALAQAVGNRVRLDRLLACLESDLAQLREADLARMRCRYPIRGDARPKNFLIGTDGILYGLDMEGFGAGPMEHDVACLHHALEYDAWRLPPAARRAGNIWGVFLDEYIQHGSSPTMVLLGYVYFLLERMRKTVELDAHAGWRRKLRTRNWLRNRFAWLSRLTGDLEADAQHVRRVV